MANNYDIIARRYDFLSRLVFGRAQVRAQTGLLPFLKQGSRLLIVGGGTGWILDELSGFDITYVELSAEMLALARKRGPATNQVTFVQAPIETFAAAGSSSEETAVASGIVAGPAASSGTTALADPSARPNASGDYRYDAILTGFLFDNFPPDRAVSVFHLLDNLLRPSGLWLFTDFHYQKGGGLWQGLLMNAMYTFFRLLCHVEASHMPDMPPVFTQAGYRAEREAFYYGGLIQSVAYRKP